MKILISDYVDSMMPAHDLEAEVLHEGLGDDLEIEVYAYTDERRREFYERLAAADALLTAFVRMDEEAFEHAPNLKVIAINATGWDSIDLDAATKHGVGVCPVGEYCTWDVAESAIAYMFALNKHLKFYTREIEKEHVWNFAAAPQYPRIEDQTLGIVGFGKIGRCTARKATGLVREVIAYDPFASDDAFTGLGVRRAERVEDLFCDSDIIVNHMCLTDDNRGFFNTEAFDAMVRTPIFINLARGLSVDEDALLRALDSGRIRAFGADVLDDEVPDLENQPLLGRDNVIITPHSAFYSAASMRNIQVIPCNNIVHFLRGEREDLFKLVNDVPVRDCRGES